MDVNERRTAHNTKHCLGVMIISMFTGRTAAALATIAMATVACATGALGPRAVDIHAPAPLPCRAVVDGEGQPLDAGVSWHEAPDPADRAWFAAACGTVGPIVLAPADQSPAAAAGDVIVVTWNVHGGTGDVRALVNEIRRTAGGEPSPPLVLLLQEAYRAGPAVPASVPAGAAVPRAVPGATQSHGDIVAVARALAMHLAYVPSMRNGRTPGPSGPEDRGTAILSTLPLSDVTAIELPRARHRRVAVAATVSADATGRTGPLRVASLHLDTVGSWRRLYLFSSQHRARQAEHVMDMLGDEAPLVIGADLNTWADGPAEPAVTYLLRALPDTPSPRWQPTFRGLWRLDYLFFRLPDQWQAQSRRLDTTFGSDHHPVAGRLDRR